MPSIASIDIRSCFKGFGVECRVTAVNVTYIFNVALLSCKYQFISTSTFRFQYPVKMKDFTRLVFCASLLVLVFSRSPIDQRLSNLQNHKSATNVESEDLLQKIEELDQMIQAARQSRYRRSVEDENDIVGEKEMISVMGRIDLAVQDNVEVVADVLKTLSGETQLEFLMKKFMMDEEDEKVYSKRSTHAHEGNIAFVKHLWWIYTIILLKVRELCSMFIVMEAVVSPHVSSLY